MKPNEAIQTLLKEQKRSKRYLALEVGISAQALDNRLKGNIQVNNFVELANALNYDVVLLPKNSENDGIIIDNK